jgi:hypothetical protein
VNADALKHVHQVGVRVDVMQSTRGDQTLDQTDMLGAQLCPAK